MRRRNVLLVFLLLMLMSVFACKTTGGLSFWGDGYGPSGDQVHRITVFSEAAAIKKGPNGVVLVLQDSLKIASQTGELLNETFMQLGYSLPRRPFLLVGSYAAEKNPVADKIKGEPIDSEAPIHLDPNLAKSGPFKEVLLGAISEFTGMIVAGPEKMKSAALGASTAQTIAARYGCDAFLLSVAVVRKVPGESYDGELNSARVGRLRAPMVALGLFAGDTGRLIWHGQRTFTESIGDGAIRSAAKELLIGFPARTGNIDKAPAIPKMPTIQQERSTDQTGTAPAGIPATLRGTAEINLFRIPGALGDVVATVKNNTRVGILKRKLDWYYVAIPGGTRGWVYQKWVRVQDE
jgi:Bacterial SH3 domain